MKRHLPLRPLLAGLALFAGLAFVPTADAQLLSRWFGPKATDKNSTKNQVEPRRVSEINVEVAWLADPVTFPYYLEAHATTTQLEVRGYVPNKTVREHAMRIAQVHSAVPVTDSMKEHPSLLVRPGQMSPQQLQTSVMSSLRVALPKQHQQLQAECGGDGKVCVVGPVTTYEEKMAVSHSLRRLHGCTSVQNLTTLPSELAQNPRDKTPIIKTSNTTEKNLKPTVAQENKAKPWWPFGKSATTKDEPPLLDARKGELHGPVIVDAKNPVESILIPNVTDAKKTPDLIKVALPASAPKLTSAELQKRIQAACPKVKSVEIQFTSATQLTITLEVRTENELKATAERVFDMPELQNYRPELQFKISPR